MGYRVLLILRILWQFSILLLYTFGAIVESEKVFLAVGGAIFLGTNLLLGMFPNDVRWHRVRRWCLSIEQVTAVILSLLLLFLAPLGPGCLFILPTFVTYAWLFDRDKIQWSMAVCLVVMFALTIRWVLQPPGTSSVFRASLTETSPLMVVALYGFVLAFGLILAFIFQIQRHKGTRLADAMQRVEKQSQQLMQVNRQVSDYANQVYDLATAEERNRIAGEIHDTVAHRLTALVVQLQAARRRVNLDGDVQDILSNLEVCEALARESLEEVRFSVRAIRRRKSDVEGIDILRRLVGEYATLTSMDIRFQAALSVSALPTQILAVLYRVLQEALTNAQRHGRATQVQVMLERLGLHLVLEIRDNGRGAVVNSPGFGLSSMRDRVNQLGGYIITESMPGQGFTLRLKLPVWEGV